MAFYQALPWHAGEDKIHQLTRVPPSDNPTQPSLSQSSARRVAISPTIALGAIDDQDRVWCTLWGGDIPIAQPVAPGGVIGIRTQVDASFDPVVQALYGGKDDGEVVRHDPKNGKMVSGLSIKLEDRDRVKLFGRMLAGSLNADETATSPDAAADRDGKDKGRPGKTGNAQLVMQITQSLGNCPKYLNKKTIKSYPSARPRLISDSPLLTPEAIAHIHTADLFFIASRGPEDMDCNHRGGPPGFIRVQQPSDTSPSDPQITTLIWPEYSGNNLYQTLGNIIHSPTVGIIIPNLTTGTALYLSGTAEVLLDAHAASIISKTKLAVRFTVQAARFVHNGLCFRGQPSTDNRDSSSSHPRVDRPITDGQSPYNPRVRYLRSELAATSTSTSPPSSTTDLLPPDEYRRTLSAEPPLTATLTRKQKLTPTIHRYTFTLTSSTPSHSFDPHMNPLWLPGQHIAISFAEDLYMGYTHMNDSEPASLNDDFVRTFTIANTYTAPKGNGGDVKFELVLRSVGVVTRWLAGQNARGTCTVGVVGFGGEFRFEGSGGDGGVAEETETVLDGEMEGIAVEEGREDMSGRQRGSKRNPRNVFIAAGIGITPLLGQVKRDDGGLDALNLVVFWTVNIVDIGLVVDVLKGLPAPLKRHMHVFITGTEKLDEASEHLKTLSGLEETVETQHTGLTIQRRRLAKEDLTNLEATQNISVKDWYLCTAPAMRQQVQDWLGEKPGGL